MRIDVTFRTSKSLMWKQPPFDFAQGRLSVVRPERPPALLLPSLHFQQRRLGSRPEQPLGILSWITTTEHRVARHQDFSAGAHHIAHCVVTHAAIHFDAVRQPALAAN